MIIIIEFIIIINNYKTNFLIKEINNFKIKNDTIFVSNNNKNKDIIYI